MSRNDIAALARLLDSGLDREATEATRALAGLARALEASATVTPRPGYKAELRRALLARAQTQPPAAPLLSRVRGGVEQATARWRYSARLAAATGATALALSGGGAAAIATERALPGDLLYPLKLTVEDWRLAVTSDESARGALLLRYAAERVEEARRGAEGGDQRAAAVALRQADESTRAAAQALISSYERDGDVHVLGLLAGFTAEQRVRIVSLTVILQDEARDVAEDVLVVLERIEQRVAVVGGCARCGEGPADDERRPRSGLAFDFTDVPPAGEPFQACPCAPPPPPESDQPQPAAGGSDEGAAAAPPRRTPDATGDAAPSGEQPSGDEPPPADGAQPSPSPEPDDRGDGGVAPPLPDPAVQPGDLVDELLSEIIDDLPVSPPELLEDTVDGLTDTVDDVIGG